MAVTEIVTYPLTNGFRAGLENEETQIKNTDSIEREKKSLILTITIAHDERKLNKKLRALDLFFEKKT